jgi:hypothetical protein
LKITLTALTAHKSSTLGISEKTIKTINAGIRLLKNTAFLSGMCETAPPEISGPP